VISPLFWIFLAPLIYPSLSYKGFDLWVRIELFVLHTLPLASSSINFIITDMVFPKSDGKFVFFAGILYMFCNAYGTEVQNAPLYPIADWSNIPETMAIFIFISIAMTVCHYVASKIIKY
jgi:uncharacterized membrane protein